MVQARVGSSQAAKTRSLGKMKRRVTVSVPRFSVGIALSHSGWSKWKCQIVTAEKPPSTTMLLPVTNDDAFRAASQMTAPASSRASPKRAIGV